MLRLDIPAMEFFDEKTYEFVQVKSTVLTLEHSLLSISKWESKWKKPYISQDPRTVEETIDYVKCMTLDKNVDPSVYDRLTTAHISHINDYINDPMTATTINDSNHKGNHGRFVTSELIYAWMFELRIPKECEKWHLNRLITLIRVMDNERQPKKKMKRSDIYRRNAELNAARRAKLGTKG